MGHERRIELVLDHDEAVLVEVRDLLLGETAERPARCCPRKAAVPGMR